MNIHLQTLNSSDDKLLWSGVCFYILGAINQEQQQETVRHPEAARLPLDVTVCPSQQKD